MTQDELAKCVVTQITTSPAVREDGGEGERSPEKAQNLLLRIEELQFEEALKLMYASDTYLFKALCLARDFHTVRFKEPDKGRHPIIDWASLEATWRKIKAGVRAFAYQHSGQELLKREWVAKFFREEVRPALREAAQKN
jgi:hypothetical protein